MCGALPSHHVDIDPARRLLCPQLSRQLRRRGLAIDDAPDQLGVLAAVSLERRAGQREVAGHIDDAERQRRCRCRNALRPGQAACQRRRAGQPADHLPARAEYGHAVSSLPPPLPGSLLRVCAVQSDM